MSGADPTVIWPAPPRWTREQLLAELRTLLGGRVREAYLIGSHADGTADGDSDVDLILVADTDRAWPERGESFADLYERFGDVDLLVYAPAEWAKLREAPSPFLSHASASWVRIC